MTELSLKEIQQETLKGLKELDRICRSLNITYFLTFGTLIGAVRNSGFIPWDDDIDVMMFRKDFDILREYIDRIQNSTYPYKICCRQNTQNYTASIPRFVNTNFVFKSHNCCEKPFDLGIFVDIYPIHNCGNDKKTAVKIFKKIQKMNKRYCIYINPNDASSGLKRILRRFYSTLLAIKWGKGFDIQEKIDVYLKKTTSDTDKYVAIFTEEKPEERSLYKGIVEHKFEDLVTYIPKAYDSILQITYTDYMALPPLEERVPHHGYSIYLK